VQWQSLSDYRRAVRSAAIPSTAYLEITYRCNWRCLFCYNPRHHDLRPLSLDDWRGVIDGLRAIGAMTVTLTGGEALTHRNFFEIAGYARDLRLAVKLYSNGSLITPEVARRLRELRVAAVEMSLHGATAAVHDRATERPGSFEALWAGVRALSAEGVRLKLKTPLTRLNEHEIDGMMALVADRGIEYRIDPQIAPRDDGDLSPLGFAASPEAILKTHERGSESSGRVPVSRRRLGEPNCGLGRSTIAIDPEGNVYPCLQWRTSSLGNVRDVPLVEIWNHSAERAHVARIAVEANDNLLRAGGDLADQPFCPAIAALRGGSPTEPYPALIREAAIVDPLRRRRAKAASVAVGLIA